MSMGVGALKPAKGFTALFSKHEKGVITAKNGEKLLKKGYVQDADGVVSKGTGIQNKIARNPINTALIGTGVAVGGSMAYGAYQNGAAGGGDSFQSGAE